MHDLQCIRRAAGVKIARLSPIIIRLLLRTKQAINNKTSNIENNTSHKNSTNSTKNTIEVYTVFAAKVSQTDRLSQVGR